MRSHLRGWRPVAAALVLLASVTACGSTSGSAATSSSAPAGAITASDPWVKTAPSGMTAAFVTLTNSSDSSVVLTAVSTSASPMVQLHEMVMKDGAMVMQEKKSGIEIPAHGSTVLEPGGNHIMLMGLSAPIKAGDEVTFELSFSSGPTLSMTAVAKDFDGAQESYQPSPSTSMSGM
jgi:periplasmic copper chaperone A